VAIVPSLDEIVKADRRLKFENYMARVWSMSLYEHLFELAP
jgi:hypothetical protein